MLRLVDFAQPVKQLYLGRMRRIGLVAARLSIVDKELNFLEQHPTLIGARHLKVELDRLILEFFQDLRLIAAVT